MLHRHTDTHTQTHTHTHTQTHTHRHTHTQTHTHRLPILQVFFFFKKETRLKKVCKKLSSVYKLQEQNYILYSKGKGIPLTDQEGPRGMWMQGSTHSHGSRKR